jgi:hypothetical protein
MAATPVPVTTIDRTGSAAPPAEVAMDIANGNVLNGNNGAMWIEVTNSGGTSKNLTATQINAQDGVASPGKVWALTAAAKRRLGPFPVGIYGASVLLAPEAGSTLTIMGYQLSAG